MEAMKTSRDVRPVKSTTVTMVPFSASKAERSGVSASRFRRR